MQEKQRFKCLNCQKTFVWKEPHVKKYNEQNWFKLWVTESFCIRQLIKISGYSKSKLERIKDSWLDQLPKEKTDYTSYKYIIFDGTYFHKDGCLMCLMDAKTQKIISNIYAIKEGYKTVYPWFCKLKEQGLNPLYIAMDGEQSVIRAIKGVWPTITIQRCLYHIQREGMRWLRTYPKTEAGKELRYILSKLTAIKSIKERNVFINNYNYWLKKYKEFVLSLPVNNIAFKDLKRTMVLIKNALPNMFHYLKEPNIPSTTNAIEGFYSKLKSDYNRHRGLTKKHRISYLKWYCYFKNNNTF